MREGYEIFSGLSSEKKVDRFSEMGHVGFANGEGHKMAYAQQLRMIAAQADRREEAIVRLEFCFDAYLEFTRDGRQPTTYADGSIAMDATKSLRQLEEAICDLLGLPADTLAKYEDAA